MPYSSPTSFGDLSRTTVTDSVGVGGVTVTSGLTTVIAAPSVTVNVGERVLITGHCHATKGATAGNTITKLFKSSGTGELDWLTNSSGVFGVMDPNVPISGLYVAYYCYMSKVVTAGTLVLAVQASSAGSNSSVGQGGATIQVEVLRA